MQHNADLKSAERRARSARARFSLHPSGDARAGEERARQCAPVQRPRRRRARPREYLASLDGMVYGEDPSEGFARGRRFLHPKLGFTFLAPPGFTLDNTAQAVLGLKDGGGEALRLDIVSVPAEQSLADYLKSGWIEHVDAASVEDFTINGFPAATATAKGDNGRSGCSPCASAATSIASSSRPKTMTPQADRSFRESVDDLPPHEPEGKRRRSGRCTSRSSPSRAGDTVEKLARRMAVADHALDRFRVLNGLTAHDRLKPGER